MNDILIAEREIQDYLYHEHNTVCNFVCRPLVSEKYQIPTDYALQCSTRNGTFQAMESLVEKLAIPHKTYKDNAYFKCIILKNPSDVLEIASHIKEVEL